nr:quinoprotein dehydrogenase-associated putative ABC transporter substrate-binding protein [Ramlibacter albus]
MLACALAFAQDKPQQLRVCADPDNLPLSHEDGSGFENRIAQLIASDWGVPLQYAWMPDRRGFVRRTMGADLCDVIIGVPVGFERAATTRPYYRSSYVLVHRAGLQSPASFDDARLKQWRFGVQLIGNDLAASPPGYALARHGATANVRGFPVPGEEPAAARMVHALERGELDALLVWGPQAGWYVKNAKLPLRVAQLAAPPDLPRELAFQYDIAMGTRRADKALRAALDDFIARRQPDIDRILAEYAVPRVGAP